MEAVKGYLISVVSVSVLCAIIYTVVGKKSSLAALLRLICGILVVITVIKPVIHLKISDFTDYIDGISADASHYTRSGEDSAGEAQNVIIKEQTQTYILDKAASLGLHLDVEVVLSDAVPVVPSAVYLHGTASPYAKKQLSDYITETFAIGKEAQIWTG